MQAGLLPFFMGVYTVTKSTRQYKIMPYYGTKHKATPLIWKLCPPSVRSLIEPFCGSLSVTLTAPERIKHILVNDYNALLVNLWRAIRAYPEDVLAHARRPVSDLDMWATEFMVKKWVEVHLPRMAADLDYYDVRIAGLFLYGQCNYLANNFGAYKGPWVIDKDEEGYDVMVKSDKSKGISAQVPDLKGDMGIRAKIPDLKGDVGISAQVPELKHDKGIQTTESGCEDPWAPVMREISRKLTKYRILCGDWARVLTKGVVNELERKKKGALVFLDPPYDDTLSSGVGTTYICEDQLSISKSVREWCVEATKTGSNLVIMLCGRKTEHDELLSIPGWEKHSWSANAGYGVNGDHKQENIWCFNCEPIEKPIEKPTA